VTRVDFYILQDVDAAAARRFACRLAVKAMSGGTPVHLHVDDDAAAADLDDLLWNYPEHRFVPHATQADPAARSAPVVVGWETPPEPEGVLVNLSSGIPTFFGRFDRVAEIVVDANRASGRDRYKFYRDRGFPLFDHHLDDWEAA
jgi:DNA polymerase-3 subunit chi